MGHFMGHDNPFQETVRFMDEVSCCHKNALRRNPRPCAHNKEQRTNLTFSKPPAKLATTMKTTKLQSLYFLTSLLLTFPALVNAQSLRGGNDFLKPLGIDYDCVSHCFADITTPQHEPPPETWCMLNLSFRVFLRCMENNINLRMAETALA